MRDYPGPVMQSSRAFAGGCDGQWGKIKNAYLTAQWTPSGCVVCLHAPRPRNHIVALVAVRLDLEYIYVPVYIYTPRGQLMYHIGRAPAARGPLAGSVGRERRSRLRTVVAGLHS